MATVKKSPSKSEPKSEPVDPAADFTPQLVDHVAQGNPPPQPEPAENDEA